MGGSSIVSFTHGLGVYLRTADLLTENMDSNFNSDLTMAVNSTFSSILNDIQLSDLNFKIEMTPFAAIITLKKTVVNIKLTAATEKVATIEKNKDDAKALRDELKIIQNKLEN